MASSHATMPLGFCIGVAALVSASIYFTNVAHTPDTGDLYYLQQGHEQGSKPKGPRVHQARKTRSRSRQLDITTDTDTPAEATTPANRSQVLQQARLHNSTNSEFLALPPEIRRLILTNLFEHACLYVFLTDHGTIGKRCAYNNILFASKLCYTEAWPLLLQLATVKFLFPIAEICNPARVLLLSTTMLHIRKLQIRTTLHDVCKSLEQLPQLEYLDITPSLPNSDFLTYRYTPQGIAIYPTPDLICTVSENRHKIFVLESRHVSNRDPVIPYYSLRASAWLDLLSHWRSQATPFTLTVSQRSVQRPWSGGVTWEPWVSP